MIKVLITGGNGGIAQAISDKFHELPGYVVRTPGRAELDVTDVASVDAYVAAWTPDILINNAGYITVQSIGDCNIEDEKRVLDINLFGVFNCTAAVFRYNPDARIVNIGSAAAKKVHGTWSSYCASKAAVVMATRCWAEDGKRCICVSPGRTETKMRRFLYPEEDRETLMRPEDFAQIVVYASQGLYENGSNIDVNIGNVQALIAENKK
ncbi:MAG: SDR family oxidoreductase [Ruminococcaceae bacterium]|nr:SDR family oxidoreductase [Oscillospiraceae bacterium]